MLAVILVNTSMTRPLKPVNLFLLLVLLVTVVRGAQYFYVLHNGHSTTAVVTATRGTKGGVLVTFTYQVGHKRYQSDTSYGVFVLKKGDTLDIKYLPNDPDGFLVVNPRKNMDLL